MNINAVSEGDGIVMADWLQYMGVFMTKFFTLQGAMGPELEA